MTMLRALGAQEAEVEQARPGEVEGEGPPPPPSSPQPRPGPRLEDRTHEGELF